MEFYANFFLPQVLEVHQFAQEAVVAEAWLTAQEPLIKSSQLGESVDEVEQLIRRHEAFRKAAATWEERFSSLRRLTTVIPSLKSLHTQYKCTTCMIQSMFPLRSHFIRFVLKVYSLFTGRKIKSRAKSTPPNPTAWS